MTPKFLGIGLLLLEINFSILLGAEKFGIPDIIIILTAATLLILPSHK